MRMSRFAFWLVLLFLGAFWWGGGFSDLSPRMLAPDLRGIEVKPDGSWDRIYRIFALKTAVDARVDRSKWVKLPEIPLVMQQAVIAVEDNRFYSHFGFDMEGIARAALVNLQNGAVVEGGSTITQQLVKNLFLSHEQTWGRKAEEFILALDMEARYSKEDILEMYLNTIYFGAGATGIRDAARIYFNKSPAQLTLSECSMLAGLPYGPSIFSPYVDPAAARQRQAVVLNSMVKYGYIGPGAAQEAKNAPLRFAK